MTDGPVAILAGSGRLPLQLVQHLERSGRDHRILAFRGFVEPEIRRRAHATVALLDLRRIMATLERWQPSVVTLVGAVSRPGFAALLGAYSLFANRSEVRDVIARGDDQMLRGAVGLLEERGYRVVGAHELAPELVVARGLAGQVAASPQDRSTVELGLALLEALSAFDIGQAAVLAGRRVLAIEGPEGTDCMLRRVRRLRGARFARPARKEGGVLVKAAKRGQDLRVDMPTIGPRTVVEAAKAGLSGVAIGAGSSLLLDQADALRTADEFGLFLASVDLPWMDDHEVR